MEVKSAVQKAFEYVGDLFQNEGISNLGLEEVDFDEENKIWKVTVGFSRPWDYPTNTIKALPRQSDQPKRTYKVVKIKDDNDSDAQVISIKTHKIEE